MEQQEREALAALCLMAAFADGQKSDAERDAVKRILDGLGGGGDLALTTQRVLLGQTSLEAEVARLGSPEARNLAFEMAVAVCEADGATAPDEASFLERLRDALALPEAPARQFRADAARLTAAAVPASPGGTGAAAPATGTLPAASAAPAVDEAAIDRIIQDHAILTGALELLPHSLATMAIIPVQMKLVYDVGERYGFKLDRGHIQEFVGTLGIGLTGQVLEGFARRLVGGIGRMAGGGLLGGLLGGAAGMGVTFCTTWALGQVARTYYAGGRKLDLEATRAMFQRKLEEARGLYPRFQSEIEQRARTLDLSTLPSLIRGR